MGLAASQARFLTLTARKSNIEFQGQQINQQRTVLANKSSDIVNKMLLLKPPVPTTTSSSEYYKVSQNFTDKTNGKDEKIESWTIEDADSAGDKPDASTTKYRYAIKYSHMVDGTRITDTMYTPYVSSTDDLSKLFDVDDATGNIVQKMIIDTSTTAKTASVAYSAGMTGVDSYTSDDLLYGTSFDDVKYNAAMNQYDFDKYTYEKAVSDINSETSQIQAQDKSLELKLKQLDSEHQAIQTEMEAVKGVINKNVEQTFKTFSS